MNEYAKKSISQESIVSEKELQLQLIALSKSGILTTYENQAKQIKLVIL